MLPEWGSRDQPPPPEAITQISLARMALYGVLNTALLNKAGFKHTVNAAVSLGANEVYAKLSLRGHLLPLEKHFRSAHHVVPLIFSPEDLESAKLHTRSISEEHPVCCSKRICIPHRTKLLRYIYHSLSHLSHLMCSKTGFCVDLGRNRTKPKGNIGHSYALKGV